MFPNLEFVKTILNAIAYKFKHVKSDVDAVQAKVDAVQANVDAVVERQPDFDEFDIKSHSYIKNKPCYDYVEPNITIWETDNAKTSGQGALELIPDMGDSYIVDGETYVLIVNGVQTTHICWANGGKLEIGDSGIFQSLEAYGTPLRAWTTWQLGSSVKLEGPLRRYKKLDAKFYDAVTSVNGATGEVKFKPKDIGAASVDLAVFDSEVRYTIMGRTQEGASVDTLYLGSFPSKFKAGLCASDGSISFLYSTVLKSVGTPVDDADAANKLYVDKSVSSARDFIILNSSTDGSTKQFKITVDDSGVLTATEVTE